MHICREFIHQIFIWHLEDKVEGFQVVIMTLKKYQEV